MDFGLDETQQSLLDAVATLLRRHAGTERARELGPGGHDDRLLDELIKAGFCDLATDPDAGPLAAELVIEAAADELARAHVGARGLVGPMLLGSDCPRTVALMSGRPGPVRYGAQAEVVLVLDGDEARACGVVSAEAVESPYGYSFARLEVDEGRSLGAGSGLRLRSWWQVCVAAEMAANAAAAHRLTVEYLRQRHQFGKPLGSLQAIQHRLAEAHVSVVGATWLARRAAWEGAAPEHAAAAAGYAASMAQTVEADMHQLSGAIGFTEEYDLHLWTLRLHALRVELDSAAGHYRSLAAVRWG